jgi:hypothetical protein
MCVSLVDEPERKVAMFWVGFVLVALAAALVKLGALSVWVTVLTAAAKVLAVFVVTLLGLLIVRLAVR